MRSKLPHIMGSVAEAPQAQHRMWEGHQGRRGEKPSNSAAGSLAGLRRLARWPGFDPTPPAPRLPSHFASFRPSLSSARVPAESSSSFMDTTYQNVSNHGTTKRSSKMFMVQEVAKYIPQMNMTT